MSERKGILAELMKSHSDNQVFQDLLNELLDYYMKYDWSKGTSHYIAVKAIFKDGLTYKDAAKKSYMEYTNFPRCIEDYNFQAMNFIFKMEKFSELREMTDCINNILYHKK